MKKIQEEIVFLIRKALNGEVEIEEFYDSFPDEIKESNLFYRAVYDDIEAAVEHFPASIIKGTLKTDFFKKSIEYRNLLLDLELLNSNI